MNIKSTKDCQVNNGLKVLVYGDAGCGKTHMCSTTGGSPIILSAESGLLSLRSWDLPYIEINSIKDVREAYAFVSKSDEAKDYDWVCIDSLSEIAEICLAEEINNSKDPRKAYGELSSIILSLVKAFRDLPHKHVYMTAKLTQEKNDFDGALMFGPLMPGKQLGFHLPYLFDEFFYLRSEIKEEGNIERYLITQQDYNIRAKDRSGILSAFEEPNLLNIKNKILGD